ncbi:MAG TPA: ATP-binding protein [Caulobacteraceae bacterium]|nr:ATP-binding protein [Caulobacteraceae bacterium]
MDALHLVLAAAAGAVCLALAAAFWAAASRRDADARLTALSQRLNRAEQQGEAARGAIEAFDGAVLSIEGDMVRLAAGEDALPAIAALLVAEPSAAAVLTALSAPSAPLSASIAALTQRGEPFIGQVLAAEGAVEVEGRASGAVCWLRLSLRQAAETGLPGAPMMGEFLDSQTDPIWLASPSGAVLWANRAWLTAVEAASVEDASRRGLSLDDGSQSLVSEAAAAGQARTAVRWLTVNGARRAFRVTAKPLHGAAVAVWAHESTEFEDTRETLRRHVEAHDETLNHISEAVAIFSGARRLLFHNTAFAELWGLEPAWLEERPSHGEILDRLRQRRRLPETVDYAAFKAGELQRYETAGPIADEIWTLPDGRSLRVVRQPHPLGGLLLLFSDITGELKLKAQYNGLIQVQQATLDKLSDGVAVFGSDGRLRLHNDAFAALWGISPAQMEAVGDFDGVVELCVPRLHDLAFWRELKARVTDTDPQARAPLAGEVRTSERRIITYQSRPLPDGATLLAFTDVTDTRELEGALADRSQALEEAERLKRDFVGNVSYELRTPLTTIIGYSELLDHMGTELSERSRSHVASVRQAAQHLARSIDDVLDMAQLDAGEMALDLGDVPIEDLLKSGAERWAREAADAGVSIHVVCDPDIGLIRADAKRLGQTLDHLLENAVRQSPPDGTITLAARRELGEIQLQVSDTGRGIPFHVQAHIFDRFIGRDRGGPGLGLALVKALVELHGGWVALQSEPGAGATFTCHLPEIAYPGAAAPELQF